MNIAWTTVGRIVDADRLARETIAANLAVCVQVDGPIVSHYRWNGKDEHAEEVRVVFKCLPERLAALEKHVLSTHPYECPEWIVMDASRVGEKYLSWAKASSTTPPL